MSLFLHKLLPLFVLPLGWVVALLVVGLVQRRRWPAVVGLLILYLSSVPLVGTRLMKGLESHYAPIALSDAPVVDAIVPLGGMLGPPVPPDHVPNLANAVERLEAGIALWQRKKGEWLVFTGGRIPWARQAESEGTQCRALAMARGVPSEKVLVTEDVGNTADEAKAVSALMRERGWHRILLVTSALHMRRATIQFRKAGVDFVPFPVDYQIGEVGQVTLLHLLPSAQGLAATEMALREWYGIAFYAMFG